MKDLSPQKTGLDPIEIAPIDEIRTLQLERLQWSLRHAYDNVAMYRERFDAAGVKPDDLKELSDLAKFPFTCKNDLRDNYPFGLFAVPRDQIIRLHASSGTTGKPTVAGYTKADLDNWADLVARSLRAAGLRRGDMVHNAYGYGLFTGGAGRALRDRAAGRHRGADVGRADREAGHADRGFQAAGHHGDALLHAQHPRAISQTGA